MYSCAKVIKSFQFSVITHEFFCPAKLELMHNAIHNAQCIMHNA